MASLFVLLALRDSAVHVLECCDIGAAVNPTHAPMVHPEGDTKDSHVQLSVGTGRA